MNKRIVDIQREVEAVPSNNEIESWATAVLDKEDHADAELTVRIVDKNESAELNQHYRHKQGATNVLSFPFDVPGEINVDLPIRLLGDLVICADVVKQQAVEQDKEEKAHWAHMVVHGTLHLLGYDHLNDADAEIMETKEKEIMSQLGYSDPYRELA